MEERTNYLKVKKFNKVFGAVVNEEPQTDLFDKNIDLVNHRLDLILEEVNELKDAIKEKNIIETIDALTDILYVVYGAYNAFGIDGDKAFDLVHQSNMSKLCKTEEEAKLSVEFYKKENRYKTPEYRKAKDDIYYIVYDKDTTKILKSINYNKVELSSLLVSIRNM